MEPATFIKIVHLLGLVLGLGGALLADLVLLRHAIFRPVTHETLRLLRAPRRYAIAGLALLWMSGAGLAIWYIAMDAAYVESGRMWVKLGLAALLSLETLIVQPFVIRRMSRNLGRRLIFDGPPREAYTLAAVGSFSFLAWIFTFILGAAPEVGKFGPAWKLAAGFALTTALLTSLWIAAIGAHHSWRDMKRRRAVRRTSV